MVTVDSVQNSTTAERTQMFTQYDFTVVTDNESGGYHPTETPSIGWYLEDGDVWLAVAKRLETTEICVSFVAIVFNLSNVFAIIASKLHHKTTYRLLISLALADAILALTYFVCKTSCSLDTYTALEMAVNNIYHVASMACAFTYAIISVSLFAQIILPFKYRSMKGCFKVVLIVIWIVPVVVVESIQIGGTLFHMREGETFLDTYFRLRDSTLFYINLGLTLICFILITGLNLAVLRSIYSLMKRSPSEGRSARKSAIVILAIEATYVIFYTPRWVHGLVVILHYNFGILILNSLSVTQGHFITAVVSLFKMLNALADPLIYVFRIPEIRQTYKNLVFKICRREKSN